MQSTAQDSGNFFESFQLGQRFVHATPRTITEGDASVYMALTGNRQATFSSHPFALALGYAGRPIDDWLVFNIAFGKTVPDISKNAIANLGYADVRFCEPVYPGDTLSAESTVTGLKATSNGDSGVVYVQSEARNQHGRTVLSWIRWVLVRKRDKSAECAGTAIPEMPDAVDLSLLNVPDLSVDSDIMFKTSGSRRYWDDFVVGERIDHPAGMTLDESDHTFATKLYQNNAMVHFDALAMRNTSHGRRLVYGGHVISVCRALAYDGLENVLCTVAMNGGAHRAPTFAGDTLYCFSEVLAKHEIVSRPALGALRLRLVGIKNTPASGFTDRLEDGRKFHPDVVLDLDYTVLVSRT